VVGADVHVRPEGVAVIDEQRDQWGGAGSEPGRCRCGPGVPEPAKACVKLNGLLDAKSA
jgi:hypothetical protein